MLQLRLGTGNGYFIPVFYSYLKVINTFVMLSWAEAYGKCDVMRFIRDCLHGSLPHHKVIGGESGGTSKMAELRISK